MGILSKFGPKNYCFVRSLKVAANGEGVSDRLLLRPLPPFQYQITRLGGEEGGGGEALCSARRKKEVGSSPSAVNNVSFHLRCPMIEWGTFEASYAEMFAVSSARSPFD